MPRTLRLAAVALATAALAAAALSYPAVSTHASAAAGVAEPASATHVSARRTTTLRASNAASTTVKPGAASLALSGRLVRAGKPARHQRIVWSSRTKGSSRWTVRGAVRTGRAGRVRITARPTVTTSYRMRFAGNRRVRPARSAVRVLVVATKTTRPAAPSTPAPGVPASSKALLDDSRLGAYLSGNAATSSLYPDSQVGNVYLNNKSVPVAALKARLDGGEALNITAAAVGKPYVTGIIDGDAAATAWLGDFIADLKVLQDYATVRNNGTYVVGSIYSEANGRSKLGQLPDQPTATQVGQAQQIFIRRLEAAAPAVVSSAWVMGYDHTYEAAQLAQMTSPKPDIITMDPYENHLCTGSMTTITAGSGSYSITWYKSSPAYNGHVAISESGMATGAGCTDDQLARFYTGVAAQVSTVEATSGVSIPFWVMFNGTGSYPHSLTTGAYPKAQAALATSLRTQ